MSKLQKSREYDLFSDEKKFNLDEIDGLQYWHGFSSEMKFFLKQVQGGRSVMVWG